MKKLEKTKYFIGHFCFLFLVYAVMFEKHYSTDAYGYIASPLAYGDGNIPLGRVGAYIVNKLTCAINFHCVRDQFWVILLLIFSFSFAVSVVWNRYKEYYKDVDSVRDILLRLSIIILYCNVFILEWFFFVEMGVAWSFSIIFMALAIAKIDIKISIGNMVIIFLLEVISLSFYQASISYFIIFGLLLCLIQFKGEVNKSFLIDSIKVIFIGALASLTNIVFIKVVQKIGLAATTSRTGAISLLQIIDNFKKTLLASWEWLVSVNGLLPRYSILIIAGITYTVFGIWSIMYVKELKKIISYFVIILISFGCVIAPHIMTSSIWMAQRTIPAFLCIVAVPWSIMAMAFDMKGKNIIIRGGVFLLVALLAVNIVRIQGISANVIAKNKIDCEIAYSIQRKIEKYQEESGNIVQNVCFIEDANVNRGYEATNYRAYDTNNKAFAMFWSSVTSLNYYNGTNYVNVEPDVDLLGELMNVDWNYLDLTEQMIYDGNTVYIFVY